MLRTKTLYEIFTTQVPNFSLMVAGGRGAVGGRWRAADREGFSGAARRRNSGFRPSDGRRDAGPRKRDGSLAKKLGENHIHGGFVESERVRAT